MLSTLALVGALLGSTCVNAVPLGIEPRAVLFQPPSSPPGACGALPVDASCDSVFLACVARRVCTFFSFASKLLTPFAD